jgi:hypothetical protein
MQSGFVRDEGLSLGGNGLVTDFAAKPGCLSEYYDNDIPVRNPRDFGLTF